MRRALAGALLGLTLLATASCTTATEGTQLSAQHGPQSRSTQAQSSASVTTSSAEPTVKPAVRPAASPLKPIPGAMGLATLNAAGVPESYTVVKDDTVDGIEYRFGITTDVLAEANMVPDFISVGNNYFLHPGDVVELLVRPVDPNSGKGAVVTNSAGHPIFYTTARGDSLDSLGYQFRVSTAALLRYDPALSADVPIPPGSKISLMPGDLKIQGATGSFTVDAKGIPLTYTTAEDDTEMQIAGRFNLELVELADANRPHDNKTAEWFDFTDLPSGTLAAGQTMSLNGDHPILK
ncbi:MAG: LysM peptidoglycan-binding domain-containing protein [Specibacter sp.]